MGSSYGLIERQFAKLLARFPSAKQVIKKQYQQLSYVLHKKPYTYRSQQSLHTVPSAEETFFGYYDSSPLSADNRHLLFYESQRSTALLPATEQPVQLCVYDMETGEVSKRLPVNSYNWQQGARAQWIGADRFIYNSYNVAEGRYQSVIAALGSAPDRLIDATICDCFGEEYALSLNFERLQALRPDYGYRNKAPMDEAALRAGENDGVFHVDLQTNKVKLIVPLSELQQRPHRAITKDTLHKVNHIMISPDGKRFIFLHRFYTNGRRYDRLFLAEKDGSDLKLLADDDMVSHCCWRGNDHVVGYLRHREMGDKYYCIPVSGGKWEVIGSGIIDSLGDGHPSVHGNKLLFDTYPNKARMKCLQLFDLDNHRLEELGQFYESFRYYGETRCDLHPRFSQDGKKVFFDSVHEGKRKLYWINLK